MVKKTGDQDYQFTFVVQHRRPEVITSLSKPIHVRAVMSSQNISARLRPTSWALTAKGQREDRRPKKT